MPQPTEVSRTRAQRPEDVVGAELETVLYAQMLALFAPHAVRAERHLPLLLATLTSRQPALRRAAAATLRHFAERYAWSTRLLLLSPSCTFAFRIPPSADRDRLVFSVVAHFRIVNVSSYELRASN